MSTAKLFAKSMVEGIESLREVLPRIIEAIEFITLLTLPLLLPLIIILLSKTSVY